MNRTPTPPTPKQVLDQRGQLYGDTWIRAGKVLQMFSLDALLETPYLHNFVQIVGKVVRITFSPLIADHWLDIANYATLVYDHLVEQQQQQRLQQQPSLQDFEPPTPTIELKD
jgi:hypothetical protein